MVSFLDLVKRCNSFYLPGSSRSICVPLYIGSTIAGILRPDVVEALRAHPEVFECSASDKVSVQAALDTPQKRSDAVAAMLAQWREEKKFWSSLKGWRSENYFVPTSTPQSLPLMWLERAAAPLFGIIGFGVHVNGYTRDADGTMSIWVARRSMTKQTWPGYIDNFVAGGLPVGMSLLENVTKECGEEADVPPELARRVVSVGAITYALDLKRGISPETQFIFDLELPRAFTPRNTDNEVSDFYLWSVEETLARLHANEFKPNCAVVMLHFFIRHGIIDPWAENDYLALIENMSMGIRWDAVGPGTAQYEPYRGTPVQEAFFEEKPFAERTWQS